MSGVAWVLKGMCSQDCSENLEQKAEQKIWKLWHFARKVAPIKLTLGKVQLLEIIKTLLRSRILCLDSVRNWSDSINCRLKNVSKLIWETPLRGETLQGTLLPQDCLQTRFSRIYSSVLIHSPLRSHSSCNLRAWQLLRLAVDLCVVHITLVFRNAECKVCEDVEVPQAKGRMPELWQAVSGKVVGQVVMVNPTLQWRPR